MKQYLGDSVYIDEWQDGVVLTTENGAGPSNSIVLEPAVLDALLAYLGGLLALKPTTDHG